MDMDGKTFSMKKNTMILSKSAAKSIYKYTLVLPKKIIILTNTIQFFPAFFTSFVTWLFLHIFTVCDVI